MKIYALIHDHTVYNIIETDDSGWPEGIDITALDERPSLGWTYSEDTGFAPPQSDNETPPPDTEPAPARRIISNLAFDRRFTLQERVNIELASQHDPAAGLEQRGQAAALRVIQSRAEKALFIDLDDPETQSGVVYMEQAGLLTTERALEILTAPLQPRERPGTMPGLEELA